MRKIHHVDDGDAAAGSNVWPYRVRRRGDRRYPSQSFRAASVAQKHPDGVSGSDRQPQSALHRGARHRRSDHATRRRKGKRRAAHPLRGTGRLGRTADQPAGPVSASTVRRSESPRRHCAGDRAAPKTRDPRRADRGARCLGAGGGPEPAAGPQNFDGNELSVRIARFECGAVVVRSCHCDAVGPNCGAGLVGACIG